MFLVSRNSEFQGFLIGLRKQSQSYGKTSTASPQVSSKKSVTRPQYIMTATVTHSVPHIHSSGSRPWTSIANKQNAQCENPFASQLVALHGLMHQRCQPRSAALQHIRYVCKKRLEALAIPYPHARMSCVKVALPAKAAIAHVASHPSRLCSSYSSPIHFARSPLPSLPHFLSLS